MIAPTPVATLFARDSLPQSTPTTTNKHCPPSILPSGGAIILNPTSTIILSDNVTYHPNCSAGDAYVDPFYASTTVFIYVIATTTLIVWILLILLLINQRASTSQTPPRPLGWLQGRGVPNAIVGRTPLRGLGNRPWLQKVAVLLVTLGLTVASVDTFKVAEVQHQHGITDARWMRDAVVRSLEIRLLRVISGVFVWLAQVQTLIRLFPRRKEKLIIKWFGFALILCDLIFSCLNSFYVNSKNLPGSYQDAISVLSYLFQLSISLLYAAWVLYYAATKRKFAFFRPDQLNMSIVAALALTSIAIPVAFFIADISVPPVSGWGDFFRWSGAAAASVIVWEWVERIEALEREEKKDGILGREIFDEDELPLTEPSSKAATRRGTSDSSSYEKEKPTPKIFGNTTFQFVRSSPLRKRLGLSSSTPKSARRPLGKQVFEGKDANGILTNGGRASSTPSPGHPPPSRPETGSGAGVVFADQHHPPIQRAQPDPNSAAGLSNSHHEDAVDKLGTNLRAKKRASGIPTQAPQAKIALKSSATWALASNVFKRRKRSPPLEIKKVVQQNGEEGHQPTSHHQRFGLKGRLLGFGAGRGDHSDENSGGGLDQSTKQQPTVIPAPPRGQTWSPDILRHSPVNHIRSSGHVNPALVPRNMTGVPQQAGAMHQRPQFSVDRYRWSNTPISSASGQREQAALYSPGNADSSDQPSSDQPNGHAEQEETAAGQIEQTSSSGQTEDTNGPNGQSTDSEDTAVASSSQTNDDAHPDPP